MIGDLLSCQRHIEGCSESVDAAGEKEQLPGKFFRGPVVSTTRLIAEENYDQADRKGAWVRYVKICDGEFPDQKTLNQLPIMWLAQPQYRNYGK